MGHNQSSHLGGICDVASYGRSVSLAAQHCRTRAREAFDEWYAPWEAEMKEDELFQYFNRLRNQVLKEGPPKAVGYRASPNPRAIMAMTKIIEEAQSPEMREFQPGVATTTTFYEDPPGAMCEKPLPDGRKLTEWIPLSADLFSDWRWFTYLPEPPKWHGEEAITDITLQGLGTIYVTRLGEFVVQLCRTRLQHDGIHQSRYPMSGPRVEVH